MTRWWKCDLQVATPGEPRFARLAHWDVTNDVGRLAAANEYMKSAKASGVEVVVLADHNSTDWIDVMKSAGKANDVYVFPGFEVGTGSGADGVHLVVFGDMDRTQAELELLLSTACGFNADNPRFQPHDSTAPATSPRTLSQILDALPDGYLAIAPHAFTDNGVASRETANGDIRWKALHHDRLGAIDVGHVDFDVSVDDPKASWRHRFIRRRLDNLPCLPNLTFVSTSDAYSLDAIGSRFTWIRMSRPSIEAIRQAFLDHQARVVCDWDLRFQGHDPNDVSHAWVKRLTVNGLVTSDAELEIEFDPRLTVLIGGRGSGKSTVVAALRNLYGDADGLPRIAKQEAESVNAALFGQARLASEHALAFSGEIQSAAWTVGEGSLTVRTSGDSTPTEFSMRIISQKELFERATDSSQNGNETSQNLMALIDDALDASGALNSAQTEGAAQEAVNEWVAAAQAWHAEELALAGRQPTADRVAELRRQVAAFDDEANLTRRSRNDSVLSDDATLRASLNDLSSRVSTLRTSIEGLSNEASLSDLILTDDARPVAISIDAQRIVLVDELSTSIGVAAQRIETLTIELDNSAFAAAAIEASNDLDRYLAELSELGVDPEAYADVRDQLAQQSRVLADLERRAADLPAAAAKAEERWLTLVGTHEERSARRSDLLETVASRSGTLRFTLYPFGDAAAWVSAVRELLGLRSDGFLEDVPALAEWLWLDPAVRKQREITWRMACITRDFGAVAAEAGLRAAWTARLNSLDPLVATRLAAELPDDRVAVEFLADGVVGSGSERWVPLTAGSPGQRSSAMLSFVLHQGTEPLVLDQPEDDLDTEWITQLVVEQIRASRWHRQLIVVTHNANIPVNADAERVVVLENVGGQVGIRTSTIDGVKRLHSGPIEDLLVRDDIQRIMEGGVEAFVRRERRYNNETSSYRLALKQAGSSA